MKIKKILLLWSQLADYSVASLRKLSENKDVELYIIHRKNDPNAPYEGFDLSFFKKEVYFEKENEKELYDFCVTLNPDIIIMASWNYSFYMSVARQCKKAGTYVVSTFDGQWLGTPKQRLGILSSPFFLKPAIDNFFVPGDRQASFARKLGYKSPFIGYYSANTERFCNVQPLGSSSNKFIFVGRLVSVKGIDCLMSAYKKYRKEVNNPWNLVICGKGELQHLVENQEGVEIHGFTQPAQLPERLAGAKCLILPSVFEPWGLVVHEAALAGLAIISSYASGASTYFVRDGQNGFIVNPDEESLLRAMKDVSQLSEERFNEMSATSKLLGSLWTTEKWARYVYENICNR